MLSEARQKRGEINLFSAKGAEKVVLNKVRCGGMVPLSSQDPKFWQTFLETQKNSKRIKCFSELIEN